MFKKVITNTCEKDKRFTNYKKLVYLKLILM